MQGKKLALLLSVFYGCAFLAGFGENLMNMALMSIMKEFTVNSVTAQWLVTGYMIVATVMVVCTAFLYRRVKLRILFLATAALTFAGSVMGLFAASFEFLLAARLVQAAGMGGFIPMMWNTILALTPKNKLGTYMSIGGCMITFGPAFAPVVCGGLVTSFGWRSIFAVPAITMLILAVMGLLFLKNLDIQEARLDIPSVILASLSLICLSFGLSILTSTPVRGGASLALALAFMAVFVLRQLKCANPLVDLAPVRNHAYWPALILVFIAMMSTFSTTVLLPLYFEGAMGMSSFMAGIIILVPVFLNALSTLASGRVMDKHGEWPLIPLGFASIACGFVVFALAGRSFLMVPMFLAAILTFVGVGMAFTASQTAGLRNLPHEQNPHGVALTSTFIMIAACVGPPMYIGIMSSVQTNALMNQAGSAAAVAEGFSVAMIVAAVVALIGFTVSFFYARAAHKRATTKALERAITPSPVVEAIMETGPYTVANNATVGEAMALLIKHKVGGMPVVDAQNRPVGFISDGDIMRYLADKHPLVTGSYSLIQTANDQNFDTRLKELMSLPVSAIATDTLLGADINCTLEEVCTILAQSKIKKIPVLDKGVVIGTINRSDVIRYAMKTALSTSEAPDQPSA